MAVVCYDLQRVAKNYGIEYGFEVMETIVSLAVMRSLRFILQLGKLSNE